jgi:hypothetical protein
VPITTVVPSLDRAVETPNSSAVALLELERVAMGVAVVVHEPSPAPWYTRAAPMSAPTPGAPMTAVVPSLDRAIALPSELAKLREESDSVAVGADELAHELSFETWYTSTLPELSKGTPTNAVVPSFESATA